MLFGRWFPVMTLWLLRTQLRWCNWVQVFANEPKWNAADKKWTGRLVFPIGHRDAFAMGFSQALDLNVPTRFDITDDGRPSPWQLHCATDAIVEFCYQGVPSLEFCWRGVRFLNLSHMQVGSSAALVRVAKAAEL